MENIPRLLTVLGPLGTSVCQGGSSTRDMWLRAMTHGIDGATQRITIEAYAAVMKHGKKIFEKIKGHTITKLSSLEKVRDKANSNRSDI
jgi:hypothetical protein